MDHRILVTYATHFGSTTGVATAISDTLREHGFAVDVTPVTENPPLAGYAAVVIGSAVNHGRWLDPAIDYVRANQGALQQMPVALFCVHIQNLDNDATSRRNRAAYLDEVRPLVNAIDEAYFAGRMGRQGYFEMLPRFLARFFPPLDFRRWGKIKRWAADLAPKLTAASGK